MHINFFLCFPASSHTEPCLQRPEIQSPPAANEASDMSSHIYTSTSLSLTQDKVMLSQSSVPDIEMNGIITSTPTSLSSSSSPCHKPDEEAGLASGENEHTSKDEISDKIENSAVLPTPVKSDPSSDNSAGKDNLIDRSMSVDAELDELLGDDDMNMDEIDANHNGDILLEIEEFLDS
ncbi:hypothetical protein AVEN_18846-1 [Araneus ventricosus]|uniref:Uncharacterized protein n=1 Tax=Araneus ventricosus TaxID=182803 RepID=A0A4Y2ILA6_ARAVE|nr:hypothetical protein AVEN_18846-1 [Araneus ventricosus]